MDFLLVKFLVNLNKTVFNSEDNIWLIKISRLLIKCFKQIWTCFQIVYILDEKLVVFKTKMLIDQIIISFCMYFLYFSYGEGAAMLTQPNVLEYQFVVLTPMLLCLHSRQVFPFEAQSPLNMIGCSQDLYMRIVNVSSSNFNYIGNCRNNSKVTSI